MEAPKSIISDKFSFDGKGGDFIGFYVDNILNWFKSPVDKYTFLYILWMNARGIRETEEARDYFKEKLLYVRSLLFELPPLIYTRNVWRYSERIKKSRKTKLIINRINSMKYCCYCGKASANIFICVERDMPYCYRCIYEHWRKKKYKCNCEGDISAIFNYNEPILDNGERSSYIYLKCGIYRTCTLCLHSIYSHDESCEVKLQECDFYLKVTGDYRDNSSKKSKEKRGIKRRRESYNQLVEARAALCICM